MINKKIFYKNRERLFIGKLTNFKNLPIEKQKIFSEIKKTVLEFKNDAKVYIYGSYLHGYWDEESDYDVIAICDTIDNFDNILYERYKIKTNTFFSDKKIETIIIP